MILTKEFYMQDSVIELAEQLLGKVIYTRIDNVYSAGIITETEAYAGINDKASHAYGNKRTKRTEIMYQTGGYAYIYLIYGMYSLFNVVTNRAGVPNAVLIRSIFPFEGFEIMQQRNKGKQVRIKDGIGPGRLSRLLGIHYKMSGMPIIKSQEQNAIWIEDKNIIIEKDEIRNGKRIGVEYAKEDADLPYRFWINSNRFL